MPIVVLLVVALVCLVLGLVLASGLWLVASLVASAVVAYLLWHQRDQLGRSRAAAGEQVAAPTGDRPLVTGTAFNGATIEQKRSDAKERATKVAGKDDVWVIDGKAHFHGEFCAQIEGQGAEPIPVEQAVQDGFTSCPFCKPSGPRHDRRVWVVDGAPEYHEASCASIAELQAEAIALEQAQADGFVACAVCDAGRTGSVTTTDAEHEHRPLPGPAAAVWVVDGRPRYHARDCLIIADQDAEQIPLAQASEDGFIPCTLCSPAASTSVQTT